MVHGDVADAAQLAAFLRGRAETTGFVTACFAVAAWHACRSHPAGAARDEALRRVDAELRARTPLPALRRINADLGRLLQRSMQQISPAAQTEAVPQGLQQPLLFGALGHALGLDPRACATIVLHDAITVPATAAVKVLHLSPFDAHRAAFDLTPLVDELAVRAAAAGTCDPAALPALSTPLSDIATHLHRDHHGRLFAS